MCCLCVRSMLFLFALLTVPRRLEDLARFLEWFLRSHNAKARLLRGSLLSQPPVLLSFCVFFSRLALYLCFSSFCVMLVG
jgi:hypothetical protein